MSGRDLLYKPPVPVQLPDDTTKPADKSKAKRSRDLGGVPGEAARPSPSIGQPGCTPAYKAAYFNRDSSGVHQANLHARSMQALRGSEAAVDFKKVVLPQAIGVETPDPAQLREAGEMMGLQSNAGFNLQDLVGRQKSWLSGKGVTAEMILARLAQLREMVEARKAALKRMLLGRAKPAACATVERALVADGAAMEKAEDVAKEGSDLVRRVSEHAEGMHRRIAKTLGIKR